MPCHEGYNHPCGTRCIWPECNKLRHISDPNLMNNYVILDYEEYKALQEIPKGHLESLKQLAMEHLVPPSPPPTFKEFMVEQNESRLHRPDNPVEVFYLPPEVSKGHTLNQFLKRKKWKYRALVAEIYLRHLWSKIKIFINKRRAK